MEHLRPVGMALTGLLERDLMGALAFDSSHLAVRSTPDPGNWIVGSQLEIFDDDGRSVKTLDTDGLSPDVAAALRALRDIHGTADMGAQVPNEAGTDEDLDSVQAGIIEGSVEAHFERDGRLEAATVRLLRHPDPRLWTRRNRFTQRLSVRIEVPAGTGDPLQLYRACSLTGSNIDQIVVVTNDCANASVVAQSGLHSVAVNWWTYGARDVAVELAPKLGGRQVFVLFDSDPEGTSNELRFVERSIRFELEQLGHTVRAMPGQPEAVDVYAGALGAENGDLARLLLSSLEPDRDD